MRRLPSRLALSIGLSLVAATAVLPFSGCTGSSGTSTVKGPTFEETVQQKFEGLPTEAPTEKEITNSVGMKLVLIQPGTFHMGWPDADKMQKNDYEQFGGPRQEVTISRPYYLGTTEVTQEQYAKVMGSNPSKSQPGGEMEIEGADAAKLPVESVNWDEALEFCRKLSELPEEKAAGRVYTLPTDAQWEYACRAGTDTRFTTGDKLDPEFGNTAEGGPMHLNEVGSLKPNAWGLYDMHGNVWEWCADGRRRLTPQPVTDPTTPAQTISDERIVRGGSYRLGPLYARSDFRNYFPKDRKVFDYGFRVCIQR